MRLRGAYATKRGERLRSGTEQPAAKRRILFIDDDRDLLNLLRQSRPIPVSIEPTDLVIPGVDPSHVLDVPKASF